MAAGNFGRNAGRADPTVAGGGATKTFFDSCFLFKYLFPLELAAV